MQNIYLISYILLQIIFTFEFL